MLVLTRLNHIIEINKNDLVAVVEPGVILTRLKQAVEAQGLYYPPDPASADFCTIGGNVAECAGGLRAVKYGVTGRHTAMVAVKNHAHAMDNFFAHLHEADHGNERAEEELHERVHRRHL